MLSNTVMRLVLLCICVVCEFIYSRQFSSFLCTHPPSPLFRAPSLISWVRRQDTPVVSTSKNWRSLVGTINQVKRVLRLSGYDPSPLGSVESTKGSPVPSAWRPGEVGVGCGETHPSSSAYLRNTQVKQQHPSRTSSTSCVTASSPSSFTTSFKYIDGKRQMAAH